MLLGPGDLIEADLERYGKITTRRFHVIGPYDRRREGYPLKNTAGKKKKWKLSSGFTSITEQDFDEPLVKTPTGIWTGTPTSYDVIEVRLLKDASMREVRGKKNPSLPESLEKAVKLYTDFHRFEPKDIGEFHDDFFIPTEGVLVGPALMVLYTSDKVDPYSLVPPDKPEHYYHEHKDGVNVVRFDAPASDGTVKKLPKRIYGETSLTRLGDCDGFFYLNKDDDEVEARCKGNTELYATPDGKALLVIENKRDVIAALWGGKLDVEPRGIVN